MILDILKQLAGTLIPLIVGISLLRYFLKYWKNRKNLRTDGIRTEGIVVDLEIEMKKYPDSDERPPTPVVRFVTTWGEWITEKYSFGYTYYKKGQKVEIVYNANNPREFFLKDFGLSEFIYWVCLFIAIASLITGIYNSYDYIASVKH